MEYAESEKFYQDLMGGFRDVGLTCAITSGMACVHYGVAHTTSDCDILCSSDHLDQAIAVLAGARCEGAPTSYRGTLSAPLDRPWLLGGWTSHFEWKGSGAYLDIFTVPPRSTAPWTRELRGLYAGLHTVAEMKRTQRDRDWPVATALGVRMLEEGDLRGWMHLFDTDVIQELVERVPCPDEVLRDRPSLQLALMRDARLRPVLRVEREFWYELDRQRLAIYHQAGRHYAQAVRQSPGFSGEDLAQQHSARLALAIQYLPPNPLRDHGVDRLITGVREALGGLFDPALLAWLPDPRPAFAELDASE
jgi:hypothetical protein